MSELTQTTQRLILPIPPSVNASHRNVTVNKRVKTLKAKQYIEQAGWTAMAWRNQSGWQVPHPDTKVVMRVWIYWQNNRRRDADNIFKILQDSLTGILYWDDRTVLPRVMDYQIDKDNPRLEIELESMA